MLHLLPRPDEPASLGNLRRLLWLRNLVVLAGLLLLGAARFWLTIDLPWSNLLYCLLLYAASNLYVVWRLRQPHEPVEAELFAQILLDIGALTIVLALAGGPSSPFTFTYLLPLTVGATLLGRYYSWALVAVAISCYSVLILAWPPDMTQLAHSHGMQQFDLHVLGMWSGFVFSAVVIAVFVQGMRDALMRQQRELSQAREARARDEQLVSLGTLAASTAHELGTPLGTITLLADELGDPLLPAEERQPLLHQLREQLHRCKSALATLSKSAGQSQAHQGTPQIIDDWLLAVCTEWRQRRPDCELSVSWHGPHDAPPLLAERSLTHALLNVLDNAADASPQSVNWQAHWDQQRLQLCIRDAGPGLSAQARANVGQAHQVGNSSKPQGLGLGLFLANAVIERMGGSIALAEADGGGLAVSIELPLLGERDD